MSNESREQAGDVQDARDNEEHELEAEQESAEAMDADVPQPRESGELNGGAAS
jgi:hypothetical protein